LVEDCSCKGAKTGVKIAGLSGKPYTIRNVKFKNCEFFAEKSNELYDCEEITFEDCTFSR